MSRILNIGIVAHVDAGKTSLTENILFHSGITKKLGYVDQGTTHTDTLSVEKERGISVRSASISFHYGDTTINLIDTPGHIDFSTEVERSLRVLDFAILVLSAVEGIQAHTEHLWQALKELKIPSLLVINKIDRVGADGQKIIEELSKSFSSYLFCPQKLENEGFENVQIDEDINKNLLAELVANFNEKILESYLDEKEIPIERLNHQLKTSINQCEIVPVLFSSAKLGLGIDELLHFIDNFFEAPVYKKEAAFSAQVFAISHNKILGKMAHIKILSGTIENRELAHNQRLKKDQKINRIRVQHVSGHEDVQQTQAGEIVSVAGLTEAKVGDILGSEMVAIEKNAKMNIPLLRVKVKATEDKDYTALAEALMILNDEDPDLDFVWIKDENELNLRVMGEVQIEILTQILDTRFGIKAQFEAPTIIYKETPLSDGEGIVRYTMPKPCWAVLKFKIVALSTGSGVVFESKVGVNQIKQKYQNEVEQTIGLSLQQGIKGWEVTDLKIILVDGEDHEMHSRPGDFRVATPMGIMNALQQIGTSLLEPILSFKIKAEEQFLGSIAGDIHHMRGSFDSPKFDGDVFTMTGLLPLSKSMDYAIKLASRTSGKARYSTAFHSYQVCTDEQGIIRKFKGISPLDTAKYILKARKAIQ